jgi:hypothetical protein
VPVMNIALHSSPIGLDAWLRIVSAASLIMVVVGIEKWFVRRKNKKSRHDGDNKIEKH